MCKDVVDVRGRDGCARRLISEFNVTEGQTQVTLKKEMATAQQVLL
jgi:hypothetical protein